MRGMMAKKKQQEWWSSTQRLSTTQSNKQDSARGRFVGWFARSLVGLFGTQWRNKQQFFLLITTGQFFTAADWLLRRRAPAGSFIQPCCPWSNAKYTKERVSQSPSHCTIIRVMMMTELDWTRFYSIYVQQGLLLLLKLSYEFPYGTGCTSWLWPRLLFSLSTVKCGFIGGYIPSGLPWNIRDDKIFSIWLGWHKDV